MWLPTPLYARVPQFWFLLGLLFLAAGLLLGFEFGLSFGYIAIGLTCCAVGAGIFGMRINNRPALQGIKQTAPPIEFAPAEPVIEDSVQEDSIQEEPAHAK